MGWNSQWSIFVAASVIACGGSSEPSSTPAGTGGSTSSSRSVYGDCAKDDGDDCQGEEEHERCVAEVCDATFQNCYGANYASGSYAGLCSSEISCVLSCSCNDSACELNCLKSASAACLACINKADACVSGSGCKEPECESAGSGGSGGKGAAGTAGAGANGGFGGGYEGNCPYSVASVDCVAACDNLKQIADKCKDDPSLTTNIKTALQAASQGSGVACKAACVSESVSYTEQWGCFQATPVSADCSAIAGCTLGNCPPW